MFGLKDLQVLENLFYLHIQPKKVRAKSPSASILLIVFTQSLVEMFKSAFKEIGLNVTIETYYRFMRGK